MFTFFAEIFAILSNMGRAFCSLILRRQRDFYSESISIQAKPNLVWRIATAKQIKFDGLCPVEIKRTDRLDDGTEIFQCDVAGEKFNLGFREVDREDGQALLLRVVPEHTDARAIMGDDDYAGYSVTETANGTMLTSFRETVSMRGFLNRVLLPINMRWMLHKIKNYAEREAGATTGDIEMVRDLFLASLLAGFASFWYLYGASQALLLLVIIMLHEFGHVLAMRMVGIPVRGIYIVPFLGGIAIAGKMFKSAAEDGFVSLMGPAFSLLPTLLMFSLYRESGQVHYGCYAAMFAMINGFNLLPVLPLDGGHVVKALMSASSAKWVRPLGLIGSFLGVTLAVYLQSWIFAIFVMLGAAQILSSHSVAYEKNNISSGACFTLLIGLIVTTVCYVAIFLTLITDPAVLTNF